MTSESGSHLRSVEMAIRMLDVIAKHPNLTLSEVARRVGVAKSTAHRAGIVLVRAGLLERDENLRFRLGMQMVEYGVTALNTSPIGEHSMQVLADLRAATGATVQLGVPAGGDVVFVQRIEVAEGVHPMTWRAPVHRSSAGKVLAAWIPDVLETRLSEGLGPRTGYTIVVPQVLHDELERVRQRGYARSIDESVVGTCSLAVAVRDPATEQVVAAISMVGRTTQMTTAGREQSNVKRLHAAATQLSQLLGQRNGRGRRLGGYGASSRPADPGRFLPHTR